VDIPIVITGPREGEKLCEKLITESEGVDNASHEKIMVLREDAQEDQEEAWNQRLKRVVRIAGQAPGRGQAA